MVYLVYMISPGTGTLVSLVRLNSFATIYKKYGECIQTSLTSPSKGRLSELGMVNDGKFSEKVPRWMRYGVPRWFFLLRIIVSSST